MSFIFLKYRKSMAEKQHRFDSQWGLKWKKKTYEISYSAVGYLCLLVFMISLFGIYKMITR